MISPKATTDKPKNASLSISDDAGVKYSAPSSIYSTTASTIHISDAPQYISTSVPSFNCERLSLVYHMIVVITAANTAISNVIIISPIL